MKQNKIISIEELWRFFNLSESLFCIAGLDGCYSHINPSFMHLFGFPEEELLTRSYLDFLHPEDRTPTLKKIGELVDGRTVTNYTNRHLMEDGHYKWVSWTAILPDKQGNIYIIGQDCTERMELQEQLIEERLIKERSVIQATLYGQEMEKSELGKELHDNVNQMLGAAKLYLDVALTEKEMAEDYIKKGRDIISDAIEEIRGLTKALVGPSAREISLVESVKDLVDTFKHKKNINILFTIKDISENLAPNLKLMLFRIVQEQLTNILKHAYAGNVKISIESTAGEITLTIQDDGIGFNPKSKKKGIGLTNIMSRARLFDGHVDIKSSPRKGCLLTVIIPPARNQAG